MTITTTTGTASYPIPPSFPTPDLLRHDHEHQEKPKLSSPIHSMPPPSHPRLQGPATPPSSSVSRPSSPDQSKVGSSPSVPPTQAGFAQSQIQNHESHASSEDVRVAVTMGQTTARPDLNRPNPHPQVGESQTTSIASNAHLDSTPSDLEASLGTKRLRNDSISSQPPTIRLGFGESDDSTRKSSMGGVGFSWGFKTSS